MISGWEETLFSELNPFIERRKCFYLSVSSMLSNGSIQKHFLKLTDQYHWLKWIGKVIHKNTHLLSGGCFHRKEQPTGDIKPNFPDLPMQWSSSFYLIRAG
jgi:hypothetical protein